MRILFWAILLSIPAVVGALVIAELSYWGVPTPAVKWAGDERITFDPDIGFILRPHAVFEAIGAGIGYQVIADGRGARVSRIGEESPDHQTRSSSPAQAGDPVNTDRAIDLRCRGLLDAPPPRGMTRFKLLSGITDG